MDTFLILQILQNFFIRIENKMQVKQICYKSPEQSVNAVNLSENKIILKINTNLIPITVKGQTWYECYDKVLYNKIISLKKTRNYTKY